MKNRLLNLFILFALINCFSKLCTAQYIDEIQISKYNKRLDKIDTLQKINRTAQSYELIKEMIIELNNVENSMDLNSIKQKLYFYSGLCFDPYKSKYEAGGAYFYKYKEYLMDLEYSTYSSIMYKNSFGEKEAKKNKKFFDDLAQKEFKAFIELHSDKIDFAAVDTSLLIYDNKNENKVIEEKSDNIINLTVSGRGSTKDNAILNALRLAMRQGFSSFITTNTKILNDSLVNDEVNEMTNGSINKFNILTSDSISKNDYSVVLNVLISVNKMNDLVKSKGIDSKFEGAEFEFNQKLSILNAQNEVKTLKSILDIAFTLFKNSIDYNVNTYEPVASINNSLNWEIPIDIEFKFNQNIKVFSSYLYKNLRKLSLDYFGYQNFVRLGLSNNIKILAIGPVPMLSYNEEVIHRNKMGLNTPAEDQVDDLYDTYVFHNNKRLLKEYHAKKEKLNELELNDIIKTCKLFGYSTSVDSLYLFTRPSLIFDYTPFIYFRNNESINLMNNFLNQICTQLFNYKISNGITEYSLKDIITKNDSLNKLMEINITQSKFFPALDRDLSYYRTVEPSNIFNNLNKIFSNEYKFYSSSGFNVPVSNELFNFIYDKNGDNDNMVATGKINEKTNMYINLNAFENNGKSSYRIKYIENLVLEDIKKISKYRLIPN